MSQGNSTRSSSTSRVLRAVIASCLLASAPQIFSQTVSATLRGQVLSDTTPASGATVTATNTETGFTRTVQSASNGSYALAGLPPGTYKIDVSANGKSSSENVTLQVGQTATLDLNTQPKPVDTILVAGTRVVETKTSEVAS